MATATGGVSSGSIVLNQAVAGNSLASGQFITMNPETLICNFKSGLLADLIDTAVATRLTFPASTPQTIDLLSILDVAGLTVSFARIRMLAIKVNSTVDGAVLLVGAAGTGEFDGFTSSGGKILVYPSTTANGGYALFSAPNTTGAPVSGSSHLLKLDPGANAMTVDLIVLGCSA